ncbi:MAG TPA: hypothetical protein VGP63_19810 [Planctomycetaceae bacterium]|nr:hypothetical protein [Planctomycetaceae bacterium]
MSNDVPPESRSYLHAKCSTETVVGGTAFENVSNPMSSVTRTWCSQCGAYFPMSDYAWSDTGEKISDYYARHSKKATDLQHFLCSKKVMIALWIIGFISAAIGAYFLFEQRPLGAKLVLVPIGGAIGVAIASVVFVEGLANPIRRNVCGVKDTRLLK